MAAQTLRRGLSYTFHYSARDNGVLRKLAAYVILGISCTGHKEVLTIQVGENESAKYWLSVLNEFKNRGVKDIMIICAGGLTGIKEAIATAFPNTQYQRCLVHQVRNTLKYVPDKDRKAFAKDLKTIYNAPTEEEGRKALDAVTEKWDEKYPRAMKRWYDNWDAICPIFKFSAEVRTVIYTTYTDIIIMPIFAETTDVHWNFRKISAQFLQPVQLFHNGFVFPNLFFITGWICFFY